MPSYHIQFVGDAIHKSFRIVWHDLRGLTPWVWWETISILVGASVCCVCLCQGASVCASAPMYCVYLYCGAVCCVLCACANVCLSLRNMLQWLSVLVWDVFRQRTISKVLIRQFDFNETSSVDSRQQYKLSMKNGKKVRNNFVIQFWIMPHFEYNFPNSSFCLWFLLTPCQLFANKILEYFTIQRSVHTESIQQWK